MLLAGLVDGSGPEAFGTVYADTPEQGRAVVDAYHRDGFQQIKLYTLITPASQMTYEKLLEVFWHNVDPTQSNGQFCDHGTQYRSAIFYKDEAQRKAAEESKRRVEEMPRFKGKIVTQIVAASTFYPAEEYHQDFYKKSPVRYQSYRKGCGRDARLKELWGDAAGGRH